MPLLGWMRYAFSVNRNTSLISWPRLRGPLQTVSKCLGHSSVNVTAKVYSHSFSAGEIRAAEVIDPVLSKNSNVFCC